MFRNFVFLILVVLFWFLPSKVDAAFSMSISSVDPASVSTSEQEVTVNITIADLPSESYFRVAWQESSGKPYFGYVKNNNGDWVKIESGKDCKNYFKVSDLNTTSFSLVTKIGSDNTANNGENFIKARRYTDTAACSETDSEPFSIQINLPTPTPTNTPPTNTPAPQATATPTKTPTPTKAPTATKVPTQAKSPSTSTPIVTSKPGENSTLNLGSSENSLSDIGEENISVTPSQDTAVMGISTFNFPWLFIALGLIFMAVCGILAYFQFGDKIFVYIKEKIPWKKRST